MALAGAIAMIGGTVMSAVGQRQQAREQARWMKYNAAVSEAQGKRAAQSAAYEAGAKRKEGRRFAARQMALYAKSGVSPETGSPLLTMIDTAINVERDARLIEIGGRQEESFYGQQAALERGRASATRRAGRWAMGTTLMTGLGSTALSYASYRQYSLPQSSGYTNQGLATINRY